LYIYYNGQIKNYSRSSQMRKLVYHVGTSLDNYISREDGSVEGFLWEGDHVDDYVASLKAYDTVLMGKTTYEWGIKFGGLEPGQTAYPWMKNYVFSKTLGSRLDVAG
jgi:dihydrofolate reductase